MKLKSSSSSRLPAPVELAWSHNGEKWRVTAWPEPQFERCIGDRWKSDVPDEEVLRAGAQALGQANWQRYLEFVPVAERAVLRQFKFGRLSALHVLTQYPDLLATLAETPALTAYLADHLSLCAAETLSGKEIAAVHERDGVYGVLQRLGLPSSRQTLAILRNIIDPDLPKRLLEPLRAALWEPASISVLQRSPVITERNLVHCCHALAA
jgi:hypothetical protein